jgi:hypothetical protein
MSAFEGPAGRSDDRVHSGAIINQSKLSKVDHVWLYSITVIPGSCDISARQFEVTKGFSRLTIPRIFTYKIR